MQTELHTAVITYLYFQLQMSINSTYPDRYGSVILQHTLDFSSQIALSWISQEFTDDKLTVAQVIAGLAFSQNHHLPDNKNFEILRSAFMK